MSNKWYDNESWRSKLAYEIWGVQQRYPHFALAQDEEQNLFWLGNLNSRSESVYYTAIEYPMNYPLSPPVLRIIRPSIPDSAPHLHGQGAICVRLKNGWNPAKSSVIQMVELLQAWINRYEEFKVTGRWTE